MWAKIWSTCLLIALSCTSPSPTIHYQENQGIQDKFSVSVPSPFSLYQFGISTNNSDDTGQYGHAFICEGKVVTAMHLEPDHGKHDFKTRDVWIRGDAYEHGLALCEDSVWHKSGRLYYWTRESQLLVGFFNGQSNKDYYMDSNKIASGDSGSPVFCVEHGKVVGLVSGITICFIGYSCTMGHSLIAKLYPSDFEEIK